MSRWGPRETMMCWWVSLIHTAPSSVTSSRQPLLLLAPAGIFVNNPNIQNWCWNVSLKLHYLTSTVPTPYFTLVFICFCHSSCIYLSAWPVSTCASVAVLFSLLGSFAPDWALAWWRPSLQRSEIVSLTNTLMIHQTSASFSLQWY